MADASAVGAIEAIARGFDRQSYRVLVPVGHRALALGQSGEARVGPFVGLDDHRALQPPARDIGAKSGNADHAEALPISAFCAAVAASLAKIASDHEWLWSEPSRNSAAKVAPQKKASC
jgi:hypothetical protein